MPPYRFNPGGGLPPGTSFAKDTLSGTPTTVGSFGFSIVLADSAGGVVTKGFSLVVVPPTTPTITVGGTVGDGKVGVPYTGQLSASGGTGPYTFSGYGTARRPGALHERSDHRHSHHCRPVHPQRYGAPIPRGLWEATVSLLRLPRPT